MGVKVGDLFAALSLRPDKRSFDAADKLLGHVRNAVIGIGAIAGVRWAAGVVKDISDTADHFAKLAQSTGVPIEALQELAYAGDLSGVGIDALGTSLGILNRNLYAAGKGGKEQAATFRAMGIAVKNSDGTLRPAADVLGDIADHFATIPDGTEKSALAMRALGKSGAQMIPLLNGGSKAIDDMRQEAEDLGIVVDGPTAKAFEQFNDDQSRLKASWRGIKTEMVKALLPTLQAAVTGFLAWVKANRKLLAQRLTTVFRLITGALLLLGKALGIVLDVLGLMIDNLDAVAVAIGGLVAAILLLRAESIAAAIASGAAWAASMLPILLLAAVVSGAILLFEDLYQAMTGGESVLKDLWNEGLSGLLKRLQDFVDEAGKYLQKLADKVTEALGLGKQKKQASKLLAGFVGGRREELALKKFGESAGVGADLNQSNVRGVIDRQFRKKGEGALRVDLAAAGFATEDVNALVAAAAARDKQRQRKRADETAALNALTGGPAPEPSNMSRLGATQNVDLSNMSLNVTTTAADPIAAGQEFRRQAEDLLNDKLREAAP